MILLVPKDDLNGLTKDQINGEVYMTPRGYGDEPPCDEGWNAACDEACGLDLDEWVDVEVTIDPAYEEWLASLVPATPK